jgi:hypothetical protein
VKISNNFFSFFPSRNQYFPHIPYVTSKKSVQGWKKLPQKAGRFFSTISEVTSFEIAKYWKYFRFWLYVYPKIEYLVKNRSDFFWANIYFLHTYMQFIWIIVKQKFRLSRAVLLRPYVPYLPYTNFGNQIFQSKILLWKFQWSEFFLVWGILQYEKSIHGP